MKIALDGKVAVVTGASSGMGLAVTRAYLDCGAPGVVAVFRRKETLKSSPKPSSCIPTGW